MAVRAVTISLIFGRMNMDEVTPINGLSVPLSLRPYSPSFAAGQRIYGRNDGIDPYGVVS